MPLGKPIDQAGTIGIGDGQSLSRLARVHQCPAPNGRMHFVAVKFVPIVGE
jgi:hypothetical protein